MEVDFSRLFYSTEEPKARTATEINLKNQIVSEHSTDEKFLCNTIYIKYLFYQRKFKRNKIDIIVNF